MTSFTQLPDLLAERLGGAALLANDEFFAPKESLTKASAPEFREHAYTERGKWMDGWETRRKRASGHDWCILRLGAPGRIRGVVVDTAYFKGNFPESCSIEATSQRGNLAPEDLLAPSVRWEEILPRSVLAGDSKNEFQIDVPWRFTHVRLCIHPDGGVARLRVHGEPHPDWERLAAARDPIDLVAIESGGCVLATSDRFFGPGHSLLLPGLGTFMGDGWETRRRRGPGHDWAVIRLGVAGEIRRVVVETTHFRGNYPDRCALDVIDAGDCDEALLTDAGASALEWAEILPSQKLQAHARHEYEHELARVEHATHARLRIFPDGGVSRLRLFGVPSEHGRERASLRWINALAPARAEEEFAACCAAPRFGRELSSTRPFDTRAALVARADRITAELSRDEVMIALRGHPRIGERATGGPQARAWSADEQKGAYDASAATRAELARQNREYEARFGWIFLVCATGKSADEMLANLRARLQNDPARELEVAAQEQRKIVRLRLEKLSGMVAGAAPASAR